jgi:hypothetical protein
MTSEQARDMASKRKNPGRKTRAEEEEVKRGLSEALPPKEAFSLLADLCRRGGKDRLAALTLYFAYVYGKPVEKHEVSGPEGEALRIEFISDWRGEVAAFPCGPESGPIVNGPLSLVDSRTSLAQDDAGHEPSIAGGDAP